MASDGMEIELKYRVADTAAATRFLEARSFGAFRAAGPTRQVQIEDRYLDTADGALGLAGYAVRLRRGPTMTVISVKSTARASSALHSREELEGPADLSLDPHAWPPSPARALILEHAGEAPLLELVTVRQLRRVRPLADEEAEVELSIDEVAVVAAGRVVDRFLELEAELRRGPASALGSLAAVLEADPDLAPVMTSKLERAMAVAGAPHAGGRTRAKARPAKSAPPGDGDGAPRPPGDGNAAASSAEIMPAAGSEAGAAPVTAEVATVAASAARPAPVPAPAPAAKHEPARPADVQPGDGAPRDEPEAPAPSQAEPPAPPRMTVGKTPGVTAADVLAEAGRKVLRFHFARMLAKEAGTRSGKDIEDLHGMRVATRRMRAAWRVFGDGFRADRTRRLRGRLRVLAGRLGAVRDLDVLLEAAVAHQASLDPRAAEAFEPLVAAWRDEREAARIVLLRELDSPEYVRLVEDYRVFVAIEGAAALLPASPVEPHRVRDTAASRIWLAYERVRAYEAVLRWAAVEPIHQLRIAAKWLRYTLEFFREALGPEADLLIPRVVALQDHLGWLHDADVTIALARQFLVANSGSLSRDQIRAIGAYLSLKEHELARLRRTMATPWRGVAGAPFRRLLGRAVAAL
jgi:CHAD domain-containing protein